jgi:hypothetical protein
MTILVCSRTGHFADDVPARCATCDTPIVHRPHVNPDLVKMCVTCAADAMANSPTEPEIRVTEETVREVELYNAKTRGTQ